MPFSEFYFSRKPHHHPVLDKLSKPFFLKATSICLHSHSLFHSFVFVLQATPQFTLPASEPQRRQRSSTMSSYILCLQVALSLFGATAATTRANSNVQQPSAGACVYPATCTPPEHSTYSVVANVQSRSQWPVKHRTDRCEPARERDKERGGGGRGGRERTAMMPASYHCHIPLRVIYVADVGFYWVTSSRVTGRTATGTAARSASRSAAHALQIKSFQPPPPSSFFLGLRWPRSPSVPSKTSL